MTDDDNDEDSQNSLQGFKILPSLRKSESSRTAPTNKIGILYASGPPSMTLWKGS